MNDTKWLTVDEASLLCVELGLNRTKKTIRSWARNKHVQSIKQTTQHGGMWVLDRQELIAKIKAEKEFAQQQERTKTSADPSKPVRTGTNQSEPVRTRSNPSEPVRGGSNDDEQFKQPDFQTKIRSLETKIVELKIDIGWRSQALDQLKQENAKMLDNMHGQARYIGHLEADLMRLGGEPDQQFLAAPKVENENVKREDSPSINSEFASANRPHPDQQNLATG